MPIADAHIHFFRNGYPDKTGQPVLGSMSDIQVYEDYRTAHDISDALIVGYEGSGIDPGNNAYIRELAVTRPWMHTLAYIPCETAETLDFQAVLAAGHVGVTFYVATPDHAAQLARVPSSAWAALDSCKALVSFNAPPEATAALTSIVRSAGANITFISSHLGLPGGYDDPPDAASASARIAPLLGLADLPNVYVKISALYAIAPYPHAAAAPFVSAVIGRFGAKRCLWASDFSPALEFVTFRQSLELAALEALSAADRDAIMGDNLRRLLQQRKHA